MAAFIVTGHRLCVSQVTIQNGEKLTPETEQLKWFFFYQISVVMFFLLIQ
jgi:hypothetical protein